MATVAISRSPDTQLRCPFGGCNKTIITRGSYAECSVENAPVMTKVSPQSSNNVFYIINDVWDFDNIGVSRPSEDLSQPSIVLDGKVLEVAIQRLLICGECDRGPLGFAGIPNGQEDHHTKLIYFLNRDNVKSE